MPTFVEKLVDACNHEYARWDNGAGREYQGKIDSAKEDYYFFVKEYWVNIGNNSLTGKTEIKSKTTGKLFRPAWSSAFVSFCVKAAGASKDQFRFGEAHCHYIDKAMKAVKTPGSTYGYFARDPEAYKPKPGDIVCAGREYAASYDYAQAELVYEADSFYPSHGDIVVEVAKDHIKVIGGNISDNVDMKRLGLDANGYLKPRIVKKKEYPWIAVLDCRL